MDPTGAYSILYSRSETTFAQTPLPTKHSTRKGTAKNEGTECLKPSLVGKIFFVSTFPSRSRRSSRSLSFDGAVQWNQIDINLSQVSLCQRKTHMIFLSGDPLRQQGRFCGVNCFHHCLQYPTSRREMAKISLWQTPNNPPPLKSPSFVLYIRRVWNDFLMIRGIF